jgi:hypothetical protein
MFLADGSYSGSIRRKKIPGYPVNFQLQWDINTRAIGGSVTDTLQSANPTGQLSATFKTK